MQQKGNFLLMDKNEFRDWLKSQSLTRTINKLQVHHTASPNYLTRKVVNGIAQQDHFACLEGMRNYHINTNGWSATGQNITVFEDGKVAISLDRDLNKTPAGITGANTGAICVEIIGNFDKGGDTMTQAQREAVVHLYACLCEKFNIIPSVNTIIYHAWYTASGTYLGDYVAGKSTKTCPGTNFMGAGNSKAAASNVFIPMIQNELLRFKNGDDEAMTEAERKEVDALKTTVAAQADIIELLAKQVALVDPPKWFVSEFGEKFIKEKMSDPKMTYEGWRSVAIALRAVK